MTAINMASCSSRDIERWKGFSHEDLFACWSNNSWPWTKLSYAEVADIIRLHQNDINSKLQLLIMIILPFGIIGSLCSIASVWRKSIKDKEVFFQWMLVIACLDFFYCSLNLYGWTVQGQFFPNPYGYQGTRVICYLWGIVYSLSCSADLCTLALTLERFLALCKPTNIYFKSPLQKRLGVCTIVLISLIRLKGSFIYEPRISGGTTDNPTYVIFYTSFYKTVYAQILMYAGEFVLPFLLLLCMSYLSLRIAVAVNVRRKKKIQDPTFGGSHQQAEAANKMSAMLRLLVILVFLFTLNQIGYGGVTGAYLTKIFSSDYFSFDCTYAELSFEYNLSVYRLISNLLLPTLESSSRSMNFYLYFCLSSAIRGEFMLFLRRFFDKTGPSAVGPKPVLPKLAFNSVNASLGQSGNVVTS